MGFGLVGGEYADGANSLLKKKKLKNKLPILYCTAARIN